MVIPNRSEWAIFLQHGLDQFPSPQQLQSLKGSFVFFLIQGWVSRAKGEKNMPTHTVTLTLTMQFTSIQCCETQSNTIVYRGSFRWKLTKLEQQGFMKQHEEIHWDRGFDFAECDLQSREKNKLQSGCKQIYKFWRFDILIQGWKFCGLHIAGIHRGACTSPTLTTVQGGVPHCCHCAVGSHLNEQDSKRLRDSLLSKQRSYLIMAWESVTDSMVLGSKQQPKHPAYTEGQVQTCQVKKGMSPSCKHFLSGREHFLNPGATKPFLIFHQTTADSGFLSSPTSLSQ